MRISPSVYFVESHEQVDQRCFSGAGRPNNGDLLTGPGFCRKIVDDDLVRIITEFYMVKFYIAFCIFQMSSFVFLILHLFSLKKFKYPLSCRSAGLERLDCLGNLGQRLGEEADIHHEGDNNFKTDLSVHCQHSANHTYGNIAEVSDKDHERLHKASQTLGAESALPEDFRSSRQKSFWHWPHRCRL